VESGVTYFIDPEAMDEIAAAAMPVPLAEADIISDLLAMADAIEAVEAGADIIALDAIIEADLHRSV
jgi:hypothetical protein